MADRRVISESCRAIPLDAESRLFWWLRATIAWETLRSMFMGARLRMALVALLSLVFWGSLYGLFCEGFTFLESIHAEVISLVFNAFFSSLMVMLVFSTGILLYGSMYCSREARLLLTLPTRAEAIFAHKFQEAMWFSSWGFVLLGSPMLVAYGVVRHAPWTFYALMLPLMISFVAIPATLGGILCMSLVAWLGRVRLYAIAIAAGAVGVGLAWLCWTLFKSGPAEATSAAWFEQMFMKLSVTEQKFLPSWWLSTGLIEAARRGTRPGVGRAAFLESLRFLALLVSNGMLLQVLAGWLARSSYRLGYSRLASGAPSRRQQCREWWCDELLANAGSTAGRPLRLLLVKDFRLFRRDISQWSQFVIFFGLLGIYFLNLRSFHYNHAYASLISFLNLAVAGLILSTFTTRFIFPMISLEGRRFWILGLLPVNRDQIVLSKFVFALVGSLPACCGLVLLSDSMLGIPWKLIVLHELCCVVLCAGLSGIAVGLGARMPDLRESSPAKISSGFGGTLCLVVSSLFIMAVVLVAAFPMHIGAVAQAVSGMPIKTGVIGWLGGTQGSVASLLLVGVIGIVGTIVPMQMGLRAFRRLEP